MSALHPVFADRRRLALYFLVWVPVAGFLALLLVAGSGMSWAEAAAISAPATFLFADIGLSAFYLCRAVPLADTAVFRVLATHVVGAALASAVWLVALHALVRVLEGAFPGVTLAFAAAVPLFAALGGLFFLLGVAVHYVLIALEASREAQQRALEARVLSREAELKTLRAQLQPHFLFNALNSISALTTIDPPGARRMCLLLSDFFRRGLRLGAREAITLADELALVEAFVTIEKVRFGDRLAVDLRVDEAARSWVVPPLVLQPLVENAVSHGIAGLVEGGTVTVTVRVVDGHLEIAVENPRDPDRPRSSAGTGMGLANVSKRLEALYGSRARVKVTEEPARFRVDLSVPGAETGDQWSDETGRASNAVGNGSRSA